MIDAKFDRMLEIMTHFKNNGIRQAGKNLDLVIEFQDIIGRSTDDQIAKAWLKLDASQKNIFLWSVSCCLGQEITVVVVEATLGRDSKRKLLKQFEDEYKRLEEREIELSNRFHDIEQREKNVQKTIDALVAIKGILNGIEG
jgi:hypothetical protein